MRRPHGLLQDLGCHIGRVAVLSEPTNATIENPRLRYRGAEIFCCGAFRQPSSHKNAKTILVR